jgi:hypothetical protein
MRRELAYMAKAPASLKDCAKSLSYLGPLRDGGYISERDHDRIVSRVRRDINKNGGVAGLEREGRRKRMAEGVAPTLSSGGYDPELPSSAPGQLQSLMQSPTPQVPQGVTTSSPVYSVGGYDGKHPDNEPYGMHDEENLNWHQRAGYHGMHPIGAYHRGGYASTAANSMGPMRERFSDLAGVHSQTHAGGYAASDEGRPPVLVHERGYYTDRPPSALGHLFDWASGVSEGTISRLHDALLGLMDDRR